MVERACSKASSNAGCEHRCSKARPARLNRNDQEHPKDKPGVECPFVKHPRSLGFTDALCQQLHTFGPSQNDT